VKRTKQAAVIRTAVDVARQVVDDSSRPHWLQNRAMALLLRIASSGLGGHKVVPTTEYSRSDVGATCAFAVAQSSAALAVAFRYYVLTVMHAVCNSFDAGRRPSEAGPETLQGTELPSSTAATGLEALGRVLAQGDLVRAFSDDDELLSEFLITSLRVFALEPHFDEGLRRQVQRELNPDDLFMSLLCLIDEDIDLYADWCFFSSETRFLEYTLMYLRVASSPPLNAVTFLATLRRKLARLAHHDLLSFNAAPFKRRLDHFVLRFRHLK